MSDYTPIEVLNLSPRPLNSLINGGIGSLQTLVEKSPDELSMFRGMGTKNLEEIIKVLKDRGLKLGDNMTPVEKKEKNGQSTKMVYELIEKFEILSPKDKSFVLQYLSHKNRSDI